MALARASKPLCSIMLKRSSMKIILSFDSFKGCLAADEACRAAAKGIKKSYPNADVVELPLSDGGEGLVRSIAPTIGAKMTKVCVHDPLMNEIETEYAVAPDGLTAYMEVASACGLSLVPPNKRNPMETTTFGVGEMIYDAVRRGCKNLVIGIGGSSTCDGGAGMIEFLKPLLPLPIRICVASDVRNPLYGPEGAAYVFAPQKGARPEDVEVLDKRLRAFASTTEKLGFATPKTANLPGAGAAGGLGYALIAYLGAQLLPGIEVVLDLLAFDKIAEDADLIITGEGQSDRQTLMGKVAQGVLRRGQALGIPVHLLSGAIEDTECLLDAGFASIGSINSGDERPLSVLLERNIAATNLERSARRVVEIFLGGETPYEQRR